MEQKTIVEQAHQMSSKEDLLNLLNRIKQDEMVANGLGDKFHPFTMELLHYYCNPNHTYHRYKQFSINLKSARRADNVCFDSKFISLCDL